MPATIDLSLTLDQLRIIDAALCLVDDLCSTIHHGTQLTLIPAKQHAREAMDIREYLTAPAINTLSPGEIDTL